MINDDNLERRIDDALNSLNGIKSASPKPYLLTRINAGLDKQVSSSWENLALFISRPAVLIVGLCLVIFLNVAVMLSNKTNNITATAQSISTIADEEDNAATFVTIDNNENP